ncbi:MAG: VOC family protein [Alphaproteobacteria bacterium]|nr:VOC family protein [Alphaproteobacteria bacterium]
MAKSLKSPNKGGTAGRGSGKSTRVYGLRGVDLGVTDLKSRVRFYTDIWRLAPVVEHPGSVYLRGTGPYHHVLGLHARPRADLLRIDLTAPGKAEINAIHASLKKASLAELEKPASINEPGGGYGFGFKDPEGRTIRILAGDKRHADAGTRADRPIGLAHVVLNSADVDAISGFYVEHLGFRVIDQTRMMTFLCCNEQHHVLAFARGTAPTLNHLAFEMPDIDSVMRGAGRLRDGGFAIEWGVGRHGPGNNVFAYFVGPDDAVIEYTAEIERVGKSYKSRGPEHWTWPPGRMDQWGIAIGPTDRMKQAQQRIAFAPGIFHPAG